MPHDPFTGPLFIVGASRSGTAMMRAILNRHPGIQLTGETHYFDDLRSRYDDPLSENGAAACADYFLALDDRPYGMRGDPSQSPTRQTDLIARANGLGGTRDAFFEAYCRIAAERADATVWGEKTPRHVFRLPEIMAAYPEARVVCMVRDPRGVVASYRDWRNQGGLNRAGSEDFAMAIQSEERRARLSYNILVSSLLWRAAAKAARAANTRFGNDRVKLVRYEDVVRNADHTTRHLCSWLGLPYEDGMTDIPMHNSSVAAFTRSAGVTTAPADRWKEKLSPVEVDLIQTAAGREFARFGYDPVSRSTSLVRLAAEWARLPSAVVRAGMANRTRTGSMASYVWKRARAVVIS